MERPSRSLVALSTLVGPSVELEASKKVEWVSVVCMLIWSSEAREAGCRWRSSLLDEAPSCPDATTVVPRAIVTSFPPLLRRSSAFLFLFDPASMACAVLSRLLCLIRSRALGSGLSSASRFSRKSSRAYCALSLVVSTKSRTCWKG